MHPATRVLGWSRRPPCGVGCAFDPELAVEGGEPVPQPGDAAAGALGASDAVVADVHDARAVLHARREKTPEQGAATSVLLATSPDLEGIGGRYFDDCNEAPTVDHRGADGIGVASYALDPAKADRLWDISESLLQRA